MTLQEKLDTYAQACDLLLSIPGFGWPTVSLCHCVNGQTTRTNGTRTIQAWYREGQGWTVIILESWDEDGQRKSSKQQFDEQTSAQATSFLGEN